MAARFSTTQICAKPENTEGLFFTGITKGSAAGVYSRLAIQTSRTESQFLRDHHLVFSLYKRRGGDGGKKVSLEYVGGPDILV